MARVLVIDDEPDVVRLIVKVLSGRGHVVQIARDGASALARVKHEPPDVILLDSDFPPGAEALNSGEERGDLTFSVRVECGTCGHLMLFDAQRFRTGGEKIIEGRIRY